MKPSLLARLFGHWTRNMDGETLLFWRGKIWCRYNNGEWDLLGD